MLKQRVSSYMYVYVYNDVISNKKLYKTIIQTSKDYSMRFRYLE